MENRGADTATVLGSLHAPGGANYSQTYRIQAGTFDDDFHTFAIEWEPGVIRWYADGVLYETRTQDTLPRNQTWVFEHPFFVILDLAVGGQFGGDVTADTPFPQAMLVDYVRVYARGGT
jgi:beta-glucanase (GH16 family)